jgi:hypothetical protein
MSPIQATSCFIPLISQVYPLNGTYLTTVSRLIAGMTMRVTALGSGGPPSGPTDGIAVGVGMG